MINNIILENTAMVEREIFVKALFIQNCLIHNFSRPVAMATTTDKAINAFQSVLMDNVKITSDKALTSSQMSIESRANVRFINYKIISTTNALYPSLSIEGKDTEISFDNVSATLPINRMFDFSLRGIFNTFYLEGKVRGKVKDNTLIYGLIDKASIIPLYNFETTF